MGVASEVPGVVCKGQGKKEVACNAGKESISTEFVKNLSSNTAEYLREQQPYKIS